MKHSDLIRVNVYRGGTIQPLYLNKRTLRPIGVRATRDYYDSSYGLGQEMYGEGFFSDLWDTGKKIVNTVQKFVEPAKKVYDGVKQGYDVYKQIKGSGVNGRADYFTETNREADRLPRRADYFKKPRSRVDPSIRLSKHINRSLAFN